MHRDHQPVPERIDELARTAIGAAIDVHRTLGPGLLESVYEHCLAHEFDRRGLDFQRQRALPVVYDGVRIDAGYRVDLLLGGALIIEVKAMDALGPVHTAQVLTYLKLSGVRLGLLINFNVAVLRQGIRRIVL